MQKHSRRIALSFVLTAAFVAAAAAIGDAGCPSSKAPAPAPSPSGSPEPVAFTTAMPGATPAPSASAAPYYEPPLYDVVDEIDTINRDGTLYYYFQGNRDGTAKVKAEVRYGRNLWNDCAQVRIRIPYITKYPLVGNPYTGLGNIEPGYGYFVTSKTLDHSIEFRVALPTNNNNVDNKDTELKGFYTLKWKWPGWALSYMNEYDQSVIKPPAGTWTSYYEGKLTLPDYQFAKGVKVSAFWNYRVLFDTGGIFKDALGGTIFGSVNVVALSITDSWGIGYNGLWKFKFEANATAKF